MSGEKCCTFTDVNVAIVPLLHPKEGKSPENLELSDILLKFATKMILHKNERGEAFNETIYYRDELAAGAEYGCGCRGS